MNNWQDIDGCFGRPSEPHPLGAADRGDGLQWHGQARSRTADWTGALPVMSQEVAKQTSEPIVLIHQWAISLLSGKTQGIFAD